MARTPSKMLPLGTPLPAFDLPDPQGKILRSRELTGPRGLLVMFICNHCPYVIHLADALGEFSKRYVPLGLGMVGINSNDAQAYPADRPELMVEESKKRGYHFPYLVDESQAVARSFDAACTPEFYLFNPDGQLVYRGQFDDSRPGNDRPVNGSDLRQAVDALIGGKAVSPDQKPSVGCNIKWKASH